MFSSSVQVASWTHFIMHGILFVHRQLPFGVALVNVLTVAMNSSRGQSPSLVAVLPQSAIVAAFRKCRKKSGEGGSV